jgi:hypothetical protein
MTTIDEELECLRSRTEEYCSGQNDTSGLVEELESEGSLGKDFC